MSRSPEPPRTFTLPEHAAWPFPDGPRPSWDGKDRRGGAIPEAKPAGDGLRHPIVQFLNAREKEAPKYGRSRPTAREDMDAYLDAHYGSRAPDYDEYAAGQKALTLLAKQRGLADNQYLRKPYAGAVKARYGALPLQMTPEAIRKRNERKAERLAGGKGRKRPLKRLAPDTRSALVKSLCDEFTRLSAKAFEKLAVYVLSIAYGIRPEEGLHAGRPGDGQFDGFIWRGRFGLEDIYIQATLSAVGSWKVRTFRRGLTRASDPKRCVLVTASTVGRKAKASANSAGIQVIDGMELAEIMIDLGLGVSAKKGEPGIDHDFFSAEIDRVTSWSP